MSTEDNEEVTKPLQQKIEMKSEPPQKSQLVVRYSVTGLICAAFTCLGICDAVIGPTLLDIRDLYQTDLNKTSLMILLRSIGSLVGTFLTGYLLDRFTHKRWYFLFIYCAGFGVFTCLTSHAGSIFLLCVVSVLYGLNSGSIDAGCNVLCMDTWHDLDSGPFMHAIHFSFGIGAFVAPIIAEPFLKDIPHAKTVLEMNSTFHANTNSSEYESFESDFGIKILYPLIGSISVLVSFGFIAFAVINPKSIRGHTEEILAEMVETESAENKREKILTLVFVACLCIFFLLYVGMEVSYGLYIATFAVESQLNLSKSEGAYITAVFWGSFAAMRFLAIFAAVKMKPIYIMGGSFVLCLMGSIPLAIWAESSPLVLKISSVFMGIGMASVFASGFLWAEKFVKVTNRVSAAFVISSSVGADIFPLLLGQTIELMPMLLMYIQVLIIIGCIILFVLSAIVGNRILKLRKLTTDDQETAGLKQEIS